MRDKGWDVTVDPDEGSFRAKYPSDQDAQYRADSESCYDELGYSMTPSPVSTEEADRLYDHWLPIAECLEENGYTLSEPPSRQAFVEETVRNRVPPWHPYDALGQQGGLQIREQAEEDCPIPEFEPPS